MLNEDLAKLGQKKTLGKNTLLFSAGDPANGFYYVKSGEIRIYKMSAEAKEIEVNRLQPGDYFGEVILFAADKFPVYAEAVKNSEVLFFSKHSILQEIKQNPVLSQFFIKLLAQKCLNLNQRLENLSLQTVRERLIQYILNLCPGDNSCLIKLDIKKTELAKQLGTISETLSRNFAELQKENLIKVTGKQIKILNCPKLRNCIKE